MLGGARLISYARESMLSALEEKLRSFAGEAVVWRDAVTTYADLNQAVADDRHRLHELGVTAGEVVAIIGDFGPGTAALVIALTAMGAILVPLTRRDGEDHAARLRIAEVGVICEFDGAGAWRARRIGGSVTNPLTLGLVARGAPGLVVFTSGSTGDSKAILHDLGRMLERYEAPRPAMRVLTFLLLDHLGGIHTLLHTLLHGGTVITIAERTPDAIGRAVERHRVQLLPTSPTFLTMLLLSGVLERYDLSSLQLISYGTEVMPGPTLARIHRALPGVRLLQTYGLTETCTIPTRSRGPDSLWVRVGGDGYEVRVVEGRLHVRSRYAMLGYLNAPSPYDPDGWLDTHDHVLVDGEFVQILGRDTDMINVGGEKVHPAEVEGVLVQLDNIADATVYGHPSPVTGQIVAARIVTRQPEDLAGLRRRVRAHCEAHLPRFKIPLRIECVEALDVGARFKKRRPRS